MVGRQPPRGHLQRSSLLHRVPRGLATGGGGWRDRGQRERHGAPGVRTRRRRPARRQRVRLPQRRRAPQQQAGCGCGGGGGRVGGQHRGVCAPVRGCGRCLRAGLSRLLPPPDFHGGPAGAVAGGGGSHRRVPGGAAAAAEAGAHAGARHPRHPGRPLAWRHLVHVPPRVSQAPDQDAGGVGHDAGEVSGGRDAAPFGRR
mmetsp:Transcript_13710/g.41409  ORF Transcript_13710/g.41409 Transcript_13710/m.41409 type:complete len:200 (+) Transcript_13710:3276-3875(+)